MSQKTNHERIASFTSSAARKPGLIISLGKNEMQPILDSATEVAANDDVAVFKFFPGAPEIAVGLSPEFMDFILNNDDIFTKPDAATVYEMLGGSGVLSMAPLPDSEPYQRKEARDAVNKFFTRHLKTHAFAEQLQQNIMNLLQAMVAEPEVPYDIQMKRQRLAYLRALYFGDSVSYEEISIIYEYTESVVNSILSLFIIKPIKDALHRTWHQMTPKRFKQLQSESEAILIRVIDERLAAGDFKDDAFGELIKGIRPHWDTPTLDMKLEIISGFLQILFASTDTTPSAVGSMFKMLADDPQQQQVLRQHANQLVAAKENGIIEYRDFLATDNPDSVPIHRFAGQLLVAHPPTPATARKALVDIPLEDGVVIKEGTNVFISLSDAQTRSESKPASAEDLMESRIFGGGKTKCIGRPSALYELYVTTIQVLHHTQHIAVTNPDEIERIVGGTLHHAGMKLHIELADPT